MIQFAIGTGPQSIAVLSPLPPIARPLVINGTTQPGFAGQPIIELNGAAAPAGTNGLTISSGNVTVRGLVINRFPASGIFGVGVTVEQCWIGLGLDGVTARGNGGHGITSSIGLVSVSDSAIGSNGGAGIASSNGSGFISGNRVGTDQSGLLARPNGDGIRFTDANAGTSKPIVIDHNLISTNGRGLVLQNVLWFIVYSNSIGIDSQRGPLGNAGAGILVENSRGTIEPFFTGSSGNEIAYNGKGIVVTGAASSVTIERNLIHDNVGLGIDLNDDGVTPNDPLDADAGPNGLQNHPIVTSAVRRSGMRATATLHSTPLTQFSIAFFVVEKCDATGFGEGDRLGTFNRNVGTTDAAGNLTITRTLFFAPGEFVTALATNLGPTGAATSEFSPCVAVANAGTFVFSPTSYTVTEQSRNATVVVQRTGSFGAASVNYTTENRTATAGSDYTAVSGTLTWAEGDMTPRTIVIPILDDGVGEGEEYFVVRLSGGVTAGESVSIPSGAVVTIIAAAGTAGIPTLSQWALLVLGLAMGALALRRL